MEANEFGTVFFFRESGVNERASSMRCGFQEIRFRVRFRGAESRVLFYVRFRYGSLGPGQVVWTRETGK